MMLKRLSRIGMAAALGLFTASPVLAEGLTEQQKLEVEKLVEQHIIDNPEIIMKAIEKLRERQAVAEAKQRAADEMRAKEAIEDHGNEVTAVNLAPPAGNPDGKVTVVEFFDYNCGYCKRVSPAVDALVKANDDVKIVYKEFPILGEGSVVASRAALAAVEQGKYHEMHEALMSNRGRLGEAAVMKTAEKLGLDMEQLRKDMESDKVSEAIDRNYKLAQLLGINGTPAFVIGDQLVPGAVSVDTLQELVNKVRGES